MVPVLMQTPADDSAALDDGRALAELGGLDGGALAGRPRSHDDQVEIMTLAGRRLAVNFWCRLIKHVRSPRQTARRRRAGTRIACFG